MSDLAKTARAAMKAKAMRLGSSRPTEKVDSSTFTPAELLNADVKTGLRPVSRRAFKKGGKVMGKANAPRADKKPRKSGGKAEAAEYANAKINRNIKAANEEREGIKHVGALKTGGAAKRMRREDGGVAIKKIAPGVSGLSPADAEKFAKQTKMDDYKNGPGFRLPAANPLDYNKEAQKRGGKVARKGRAKKQAGGGNSMPVPVPRPSNPNAANEARELAKQAAQSNATTSPEYRRELEARQNPTPPRKSGGRAKKAIGGPQVGAAKMMDDAASTSGVPSSLMQFSPIKGGKFANAVSGMKKGGKAHEDVAQDKALIKKMVKPEARRGKAIGGIMGEMFSPALMLANAIRGKKEGGRTGKAGGGRKTDDYQPTAMHSSDPRLTPVMAKAYKMIEDQVNPEKMRDLYMKSHDARMKDPKYAASRTKRGMDPDVNPFADKTKSLAQLKKADDRALEKGYDASQQEPDQDDLPVGAKNGKMLSSLFGGRTGRKTGGGVFTGPSYPGKIPGVVPGGRTARASGGKAKGKTNINIVIAAGKQQGGDGGPMPMGMPKPMGGIPIPLAPQGGPPQGGAPIPMPMPMPMPMPGPGAGGPPGMPPMGRKAGGRISKVASSYKDMEAGSAGGEGRLQKTDIAKKGKGAPTFKKGGKVYRSYKDMDAGSASGLGRLEKSEIAARKG